MHYRQVPLCLTDHFLFYGDKNVDMVIEHLWVVYYICQITCYLLHFFDTVSSAGFEGLDTSSETPNNIVQSFNCYEAGQRQTGVPAFPSDVFISCHFVL